MPHQQPQVRATDSKRFQKKNLIVKEESCHNFLNTRSCFGSSVSDGRYLMVQITLTLLYMPAQIIQMMTFTRIMAIWTPAITPQDHLKKYLRGLICILRTSTPDCNDIFIDRPCQLQSKVTHHSFSHARFHGLQICLFYAVARLKI